MLETTEAKQKLALLLSRSLLGTLTLLGLIVTYDMTKYSHRELLVVLIIANLGLILTRVHTELITMQITTGHRVRLKDSWPLLRDSAYVAIPSMVPVLIIAARALGLIPDGMGIAIAKYSTVAVLFLIGFLSTRLIGGTYLKAVLYGLFDTGLGMMIVALKLLA